MIDEDVISYYFSLNKRIAKAKRRLKEMRIEFYQQTMSSYCTSDEDKIYSHGFPVEKKVITLVDAQAMAAEHIEILAFKQKHFLRYLNGLQKAERVCLKEKYIWHRERLIDHVERECFEEIQEIEEAAGYMFQGYEPELPKIEIVDITEATEETFENDFMKICGMLGV
ncbi:hypothetical protein [Trichococcus shcherbakoviae]|uniref:hypothetical protein n=1 Tax=Trichococcus shcherbakoviae TaxID=2094020 RepID=UPI002AA85C99|nr:hypothetical protein [Trichococcus shcherbakoviae]